MIDDAVGKGATLRAGGDARDAFMDATVIDHVTRPMRLYHEESFGPVASIIRVQDAEEAISVANDCDYGLSGAVFGRDIGRALKWRSALNPASATSIRRRWRMSRICRSAASRPRATGGLEDSPRSMNSQNCDG